MDKEQNKENEQCDGSQITVSEDQSIIQLLNDDSEGNIPEDEQDKTHKDEQDETHKDEKDDDGFIPAGSFTGSSSPPLPTTDEVSSSDSARLKEETFEIIDLVSSEDEMDDESTIAAEEALGREITPEEELRLLKEDLHTPVEELGRGMRRQSAIQSAQQATTATKTYSTSSAENPEALISSVPQPETSDCIALIPPEVTPSHSLHTSDAEDNEEATQSVLAQFYQEHVVSDVTYCDNEEEDGEFIPLKLLNREIRVGEDYQADVSLDLPSQPSTSPPSQASQSASESTSGDHLIWRPSPNLTEEEINRYLGLARGIASSLHADINEQTALETLMECGHVVNAALECLRCRLKSSLEQVTNNRLTGSTDENDEGDEPPHKKPKK